MHLEVLPFSAGGLSLPLVMPQTRLTLKRKEGMLMLSVEIFLAILSFGLACFSIGYTSGKNAKK